LSGTIGRSGQITEQVTPAAKTNMKTSSRSCAHLITTSDYTNVDVHWPTSSPVPTQTYIHSLKKKAGVQAAKSMPSFSTHEPCDTQTDLTIPHQGLYPLASMRLIGYCARSGTDETSVSPSTKATATSNRSNGSFRIAFVPPALLTFGWRCARIEPMTSALKFPLLASATLTVV
jgi:hypothetical protein